MTTAVIPANVVIQALRRNAKALDPRIRGDDGPVSRMTLRDALIDAETDMRYETVKVRKVPASEFDLGQMQ